MTSKTLSAAPKFLLACFLVLAQTLSLPAHADPAERLSVEITRTAAQGLVLNDQVSRNIYVTQTVQVPYDVQVPYQETETYIEQVPYQDTETYVEQVPYDVQVPYQDTETYYEQEYQCHNVTDYEEQCNYTRECHTVTDYENECHNETRCRTVTDMDRECRNEPVCHTEPTTEKECRVEQICRTDRNGQPVCIDKEVCRQIGGGREVCRDNQVCRNVPTTRQECDSVPVCRQVPRSRQECQNVPHCRQVPKTRQECNHVSVPRTRTVTKYRTETRYRSETRTRTVTKYRDETRTRTVTKYRTEQRCCRAEEQSVFSHQLKIDVQLNFSADSALIAGEKEVILIELIGDESNPQVVVKPQSHVFQYQILNQQLVGGKFTADLKMVPQFQPADLGKQTISGIRLAEETPGQFAVRFRDAGLRPRVQTDYVMNLVDPSSNQVIATQTLTAGSLSEMSIPVAAQIDSQKEYIVRLDVSRAGLNMVVPAQFQVEQKAMALDLALFSDATKVNSVAILGKTVSAELILKDETPDNMGIETEYKILVNRKSSSAASGYKPIGSAKTVARKSLAVGADGLMRLGLKKHLGLSDSDLKDFVNPTRSLRIDIEVVRKGARLPQAISIKKSEVVKVP